MERQRVLWFVIALFMIMSILLVACSDDTASTEAPAVETEEMAEHTEPAEPKEYNVPAEDAALSNPLPADETNLQRGQEIYTNSCLKCHGETGRGDGPSATNPGDFRADYVMQLSDGELFYIITNGIDGSAMQAWAFFDEEMRWQLVHHIRKLQE